MLANIGETISCALVPLRSTGALLLPASALVEVIDSKDLNVVVDLQQGIIGKMQWKSLAIPFMSYESAAGLLQAAFNNETKAAVIRVPIEGSDVHYIAIATYGMPRTVELTQSHIKDASPEDTISNPLAIARVQVEGQLLWMPDIGAILEHIKEQAA